MLSGSATEGFNDSLDYLPGAKFLGIAAAALYDDQKGSTLELFHSGKVRFGDAHPILDGVPAFPVPFSWYHRKGHRLTEGRPFLHHLLKPEDFDKQNQEGQLKQAREGYFSLDGSLLKPSPGFSIRSAYDREERRAKDGNMFGYFSLPGGSEWGFVVEDDSGAHADTIRAALVGKKRIGRSRSAEYGLVDIRFDQELAVSEEAIHPSETTPTMVYAWSNLCFYDAFGRPTLTPTPEQLGVPGGQIIWEKCQLRSRWYQTWNGRRHNRDADRMIIEKGSVFAVRHTEPIPPDAYAAGIGSHRAEGFGKVLVNPRFLLSDGIELPFPLHNSEPVTVQDPETAGPPMPAGDPLLVYLQQQRKERKDADDLHTNINDFLSSSGNKFDGLSPSQWGAVRSYASYAADWKTLEKLLFDEKTGALHRGYSEPHWRKNNRRDLLKSHLEKQPEALRVSVVLKLAAEMAKRKQMQ